MDGGSREERSKQAKASFVIDRIQAMMELEYSIYWRCDPHIDYERNMHPQEQSFMRPSLPAHQRSKKLHMYPATAINYYHSQNFDIWRENICSRAYSTVDYLDFSRKTVAVSMNLFDRYLATLGRSEKLSSRQALLIPLTTLYISIKIHEKENTERLSTIVQSSHQKFSKRDIFEMEIKILHSLSWLVNPPTSVDFIADLLKFLPASVPVTVRRNLYHESRYMAELSVFDYSYLVNQYLPSTIALAAIVNAIEEGRDQKQSSLVCCKYIFYEHLKMNLGLCHNDDATGYVRGRLRTLLDDAGKAQTGHREWLAAPPIHANHVKSN